MQKTFLLTGIFFSLFLSTNFLFAQCVSDNFESGTFGPPWNTGSGYTQTIVNTDPAQGIYSLRNSGVSAFYQGPNLIFTPFQPTEVSWWIKTDVTDGANGYFVLGNINIHSDNGILFSYCNSTSGLRFFNTTGYNHPISANTWYHVEVKNIDWTARNMDIYVDGNLILENWAFRSSTATYVDRLHLFNLGTANPQYDDIRIGSDCVGDLDGDEDGYTVAQGDCDDTNADLNPGTAPAQSSVTYHNQNSVTVYWNTVPGSTNYGVRYRLQGSNDTWTEATSLRAWRRLYSLAACTSYEVQFRNFKNGLWNCWSVNYYFTTPCAKTFGVGKNNNDLSAGMQVFPNPTSDLLNIVLDENMLDKAVSLTLRDQLGRDVWNRKIQNLETTSIELNVREYHFAAGVYTLSLQSEKNGTTTPAGINK